MGKLGLNSGYIGSDQRVTPSGSIGYDKYFLERANGRLNPILSNTYLLDLYPGAAVAFSLRKLLTTYTGNAIRVRRSSDNTEQDIGFDSSGNLNTSQLLSFCGSNNGFITIWYDQSGNGINASQANALTQPQIVISGNIITQNSKPILRYNSQFLQLSSTITPASSWSIFGVGKKNTAGRTLTYLGGTTGLNSSLVSFTDNNIYILGTSGYISTSDSVTTDFRVNSGFVLGGTPSSIYRNNILLTTTFTSNSPAQNFFYIGQYGSNIDDSSISEVILYQSNQFSNNSGINTNINIYYGIY